MVVSNFDIDNQIKRNLHYFKHQKDIIDVKDIRPKSNIKNIIKYKSSLWPSNKFFLLNKLNNKKRLSIEIIKDIKKIIFWKLVDIIWLMSLAGRNPPPDNNVIDILRELKSLKPEILSKVKIRKLRTK